MSPGPGPSSVRPDVRGRVLIQIVASSLITQPSTSVNAAAEQAITAAHSLEGVSRHHHRLFEIRYLPVRRNGSASGSSAVK